MSLAAPPGSGAAGLGRVCACVCVCVCVYVGRVCVRACVRVRACVLRRHAPPPVPQTPPPAPPMMPGCRTSSSSSLPSLSRCAPCSSRYPYASISETVPPSDVELCFFVWFFVLIDGVAQQPHSLRIELKRSGGGGGERRSAGSPPSADVDALSRMRRLCAHAFPRLPTHSHAPREEAIRLLALSGGAPWARHRDRIG